LLIKGKNQKIKVMSGLLIGNSFVLSLIDVAEKKEHSQVHESYRYQMGTDVSHVDTWMYLGNAFQQNMTLLISKFGNIVEYDNMSSTSTSNIPNFPILLASLHRLKIRIGDNLKQEILDLRPLMINFIEYAAELVIEDESAYNDVVGLLTETDALVPLAKKDSRVVSKISNSLAHGLVLLVSWVQNTVEGFVRTATQMCLGSLEALRIYSFDESKPQKSRTKARELVVYECFVGYDMTGKIALAAGKTRTHTRKQVQAFQAALAKTAGRITEFMEREADFESSDLSESWVFKELEIRKDSLLGVLLWLRDVLVIYEFCGPIISVQLPIYSSLFTDLFSELFNEIAEAAQTISDHGITLGDMHVASQEGLSKKGINPGIAKAYEQVSDMIDELYAQDRSATEMRNGDFLSKSITEVLSESEIFANLMTPIYFGEDCDYELFEESMRAKVPNFEEFFGDIVKIRGIFHSTVIDDYAQDAIGQIDTERFKVISNNEDEYSFPEPEEVARSVEEYSRLTNLLNIIISRYIQRDQETILEYSMKLADAETETEKRKKRQKLRKLLRGAAETTASIEMIEEIAETIERKGFIQKKIENYKRQVRRAKESYERTMDRWVQGLWILTIIGTGASLGYLTYTGAIGYDTFFGSVDTIAENTPMVVNATAANVSSALNVTDTLANTTDNAGFWSNVGYYASSMGSSIVSGTKYVGGGVASGVQSIAEALGVDDSEYLALNLGTSAGDYGTTFKDTMKTSRAYSGLGLSSLLMRSLAVGSVAYATIRLTHSAFCFVAGMRAHYVMRGRPQHLWKKERKEAMKAIGARTTAFGVAVSGIYVTEAILVKQAMMGTGALLSLGAGMIGFPMPNLAANSQLQNLLGRPELQGIRLQPLEQLQGTPVAGLPRSTSNSEIERTNSSLRNQFALANVEKRNKELEKQNKQLLMILQQQTVDQSQPGGQIALQGTLLALTGPDPQQQNPPLRRRRKRRTRPVVQVLPDDYDDNSNTNL